MTRRYFFPDFPVDSSSTGVLATLDASESQHAIKVMRIEVGEEVELFDGKGRQATATVTAVSRKECHCRIDSIEAVDREPACEVTLAIAFPKPDRCREMIERLTELGVRNVVPIVAARSQRAPSPSVIAKQRRAVIEACKQSGRNVLMQIADPCSLADFIASDHHSPSHHPSNGQAPIRWIADPDGVSIHQSSRGGIGQAVVLVGPEGGWNAQEILQSIDAGYEKVGFGKRIFRIETAAAYIASRLID